MKVYNIYATVYLGSGEHGQRTYCPRCGEWVYQDSVFPYCSHVCEKLENGDFEIYKNPQNATKGEVIGEIRW